MQSSWTSRLIVDSWGAGLGHLFGNALIFTLCLIPSPHTDLKMEWLLLLVHIKLVSKRENKKEKKRKKEILLPASL